MVPRVDWPVSASCVAADRDAAGRRGGLSVVRCRMWWGDWSLEAVRVVWCGCRSTRVGAGVVSSCIVWRRWSWWHGRVVCCLSWRGIATRRWVAWVVGVGVGFLLAAAHGLPGCPGGFGGCVWWFENSIVCTVLLHHAAMLLVVWWSFDCQSDARPCGTRGGLMGVGVFV